MEDGGGRDGVWTGVDGMDGRDGGWTAFVREACFRGRLKHALRAEILKKSRLKGLQMEMILGAAF